MRSYIVIIRLLAAAYMICAGSDDLQEESIYEYACRSGACMKMRRTANVSVAVSLAECRMLCGTTLGTLWPMPRGVIHYGRSLVSLDRERIHLLLLFNCTRQQRRLWQENEVRFKKMLDAKVLDPTDIVRQGGGGHTLMIHISLANQHDDDDTAPKLTLNTDESYHLRVFQNAADGDAVIAAHISARTFFGGRHALETLSQLIIYDDIGHQIKILADVDIADGPAYKWRGLLLDTARHFYSIAAIKKTLDAMAMSKLNTFHWHITDTQSFPFEVRSHPELQRFGAYARHKIYTHEHIADVVEYGRSRGIRVMPEFDAPAHVGEGWQRHNMTVCFNAQPWYEFCAEPPCGQLDPTIDELYPILEDIYRELFALFEPDVFHMGGDEVSLECWKSSERIKNWMLSQKYDGLRMKHFMKLWHHFQTKALARVDNVSGGKRRPIILWTSALTEMPYLTDYLDKDRYIIQIWKHRNNWKIQNILKNGYHVIMSNYDALYLDCGQSGWVTEEFWCSQYISWRNIYDNDLKTIAGSYVALVLGAEVAIWSEQIDEYSLESRTWPRASALAERLWTDPDENWHSAKHRMAVHRERLVENGIGAEPLQPQWCEQNENDCIFLP